MYCRECGKQIPDGSAFCPYCGRKLIYDGEEEHIEKEIPSNPYENTFEEQNYSKIDEEHLNDDDPFNEFDKPKEETKPVDNSYNSFANLTYIFGLLGLILGSIPLCILSIVFSKKGMQSESLWPKALRGKKLAIAGLFIWIAIITIYYVLIIVGIIELPGMFGVYF